MTKKLSAKFSKGQVVQVLDNSDISLIGLHCRIIVDCTSVQSNQPYYVVQFLSKVDFEGKFVERVLGESCLRSVGL